MWVRLKKLGLPNKLYLSIFVVPIIIFYIVTGELKLLTNKYEIKSKETKINEVCMHGLLYDARFMKKDKVIFLDSAIIEVNEINNSNFKTIYYTNKSGAFFIKFPVNSSYQIKFKKYGWLSKILKLNTHINESNIKQFHLFIDAELYREKMQLKIKENNFPVIEIYYDEYEKRFITNDVEVKQFYKKLKKHK
jgi:hypothetical protein